MSRMLISKKGKAPKFLTFSGFFMLVLSAFQFYTAKGFYMDDFDEFMAWAAPVLSLVAGILLLATANNYSKTGITLYDDHVEGFGTCGKGGLTGQSFYFDSKTNYTITLERSFVCVNANGKSYFISLSSEDANEVYNIAVHKKAPPATNYNPQTRTNPQPKANPAPKPESVAAEAPPSIICQCPKCGVKCRVPAGKGQIMIKCPKCAESFGANT